MAFGVAGRSIARDRSDLPFVERRGLDQSEDAGPTIEGEFVESIARRRVSQQAPVPVERDCDHRKRTLRLNPVDRAGKNAANAEVERDVGRLHDDRATTFTITRGEDGPRRMFSARSGIGGVEPETGRRQDRSAISVHPNAPRPGRKPRRDRRPP